MSSDSLRDSDRSIDSNNQQTELVTEAEEDGGTERMEVESCEQKGEGDALT